MRAARRHRAARGSAGVTRTRRGARAPAAGARRSPCTWRGLGHDVRLWARDAALVDEMRAPARERRLSAGRRAARRASRPTASLADALDGTELVVSAIPSHGCRAVMRAAAPLSRAGRDRRQRDEGARGRHAAADVRSDRAGSWAGASGRRAVGSELRRSRWRSELPTAVLAASCDARRDRSACRRNSAARTSGCTDRTTWSASRSAAR